MNLVIVESPTKAKTITKFLDRKFKVESSYGHIRDLPKSTLGVDPENNFTPKYVIPPAARKKISHLKELAKKADNIILATDEDREGEAIAWHLAEVLGLEKNKTGRIVFHEITKSAINEAINTPRQLNMDLVDAQQARRVLDRLVGYELSPFLWKKVAKGLSAGRVQSVAVRLVVEREREIKAFKPDEYWTIETELNKKNDPKNIILAKLNKIDGKSIDKLHIKNKAEADKITHDLEGAEYKVSQVEKKQTKKSPPRPFITSTLQQTANRWFGFSAKQTMMIAQQLYEQGYITYMRTDSLSLSDKFLNDASSFLRSNFGDKYALEKPRRHKTKAKGAQEAHEAIRPTEVNNNPEDITEKLDKNQHRLYTIIWQRALASQMPEAIMDSTKIDIDARDTVYQFRATGQVLNFDGYLRVYPEKSKELNLPKCSSGEILELTRLGKEQHFTKPPARYSDAGLVKTLEKFGIGRPSTYAPTIATIVTRNYVSRDENKKFMPTDIAFIVIDLLVDHFPSVIDYQFTAQMENELDGIASGNLSWQPVIRDFYTPFHANLEEKYNQVKKEDIMPEEKSNEVCDKCNAPMIIKTGRYGKFLACSAFPDCKNIKGMNNGTDKGKSKEMETLEKKHKGEKCNKCGAEMVVKTGRFGPFLACSAYPECKNIKNIKGDDTTGITCPNCGKGEIVKKRSKRGMFYGCNEYPDCKTAFWSKPTGDICPDCKALLVEDKKNGQIKCSAKTCNYTK